MTFTSIPVIDVTALVAGGDGRDAVVGELGRAAREVASPRSSVTESIAP